jgi:hypothetical protein
MNHGSAAWRSWLSSLGRMLRRGRRRSIFPKILLLQRFFVVNNFFLAKSSVYKQILDMTEETDEKNETEGSFNASDPAQVAARRRSAGKKRKANESVVYTIMSTQTGREWMHSLLESCHCFGTSFTGESLTMAFKEGERNIGLMLTAQIMKASPDEFILMLKEQNKNAK